MIRMNRNIVALGIIVVLGLAVVQAYSVWNATVQSPPEGRKDYVGQVVTAFTSDPIGLLFGETEGSAPLLKFFLVGLIWIWLSYALGRFYSRWKRVTDRLYWSSLLWCVYATVVVMAAWIIGAAAQHYQWYACFYHCYPGEEGTMDKVPHAFTPAALAAIVATVNFKDVLGLHGRFGRLLELAIGMLILILVIFQFENMESANPTLYVNMYLNSLGDILVGVAASAFQFCFYNLVVPYEE